MPIHNSVPKCLGFPQQEIKLNRSLVPGLGTIYLELGTRAPSVMAVKSLFACSPNYIRVDICMKEKIEYKNFKSSESYSKETFHN